MEQRMAAMTGYLADPAHSAPRPPRSLLAQPFSPRLRPSADEPLGARPQGRAGESETLLVPASRANIKFRLLSEAEAFAAEEVEASVAEAEAVAAAAAVGAWTRTNRRKPSPENHR